MAVESDWFVAMDEGISASATLAAFHTDGCSAMAGAHVAGLLLQLNALASRQLHHAFPMHDAVTGLLVTTH